MTGERLALLSREYQSETKSEKYHFRRFLVAGVIAAIGAELNPLVGIVIGLESFRQLLLVYKHRKKVTDLGESMTRKAN